MKMSNGLGPAPAITLTAIVTTLLCFVVVALPQAALADDVAEDFSLSSNPNGNWSYGWSSSLGGAFNLDTANAASLYSLGLSAWLGNQWADGSPYVAKNDTANPITVNNYTTWQPGQLDINPVVGYYGVVRWTAPSSGQFTIDGTFSGLSSAPGGDSADVHIQLNGTSIFDSDVFGTPSPTSYSGVQDLAAGDHIDFVVGIGMDGSDHEDSTGLSATVVPEPGTLGLVGAGLSCLLAFRFLKRN